MEYLLCDLPGERFRDCQRVLILLLLEYPLRELKRIQGFPDD